jgi:lipopolysaccharide export system ATP-binding protein
MLIRTENICKSYKKRKVVDDISISVNEGEIVGLLGPNGAGKTTTFYMIVGLVRPDAGKVLINDEEITKMPMHKRAQMGISYLPQEPSIFRKLTVEENVLVLWELTPAIPKSEYKSRLDALLSEFGLEKLRKQKSYTLSGGEQRKVEVMRALSLNPFFILLDEPFSGVDPITVNDLHQIIRGLKNKGIGVIITDHNVRDTLAITDRAYIIHEGKILTEGPPDKIANDPLAKKFYLGEEFNL